MKYRKRKPPVPYQTRPYPAIREDGTIGETVCHVIDTTLTDYPAPQKMEHRIQISTSSPNPFWPNIDLMKAYRSCETHQIPCAAIFTFTDYEDGAGAFAWELVFENEHDRFTAMFLI